MSEGETKPAPASAGAQSGDRRCGCGKLAARVTAAGVEIKCSRCKRVMIVSWSEEPKDGTSSGMTDD
jgi:phage FluMu protein Com